MCSKEMLFHLSNLNIVYVYITWTLRTSAITIDIEALVNFPTIVARKICKVSRTRIFSGFLFVIVGDGTTNIISDILGNFVTRFRPSFARTFCIAIWWNSLNWNMSERSRGWNNFAERTKLSRAHRETTKKKKKRARARLKLIAIKFLTRVCYSIFFPSRVRVVKSPTRDTWARETGKPVSDGVIS